MLIQYMGLIPIQPLIVLLKTLSSNSRLEFLAWFLGLEYRPLRVAAYEANEIVIWFQQLCFKFCTRGRKRLAITELFIVIIIIISVFFVKVMSDEGMTTSESNVRQHRPINLKRSCVKWDRQLLWLEAEMRQTRNWMTRLVAKIAELRSIDFYGRLWFAIGRNDCKLLATTNIKSANNEITLWQLCQKQE